MNFHQIIETCDSSLIRLSDEIEAEVEYEDPLSGEARRDTLRLTIAKTFEGKWQQLYKAEVVVSYAKALIVIASLIEEGRRDQARNMAAAMANWCDEAAEVLEDAEVKEIAALLSEYAGNI